MNGEGQRPPAPLRVARLRLLRVDRKLDRGEQARTIVLKRELAIVQMGDRFGECQAEPGSLVGAAGIESAEPAPRLEPP